MSNFKEADKEIDLKNKVTESFQKNNNEIQESSGSSDFGPNAIELNGIKNSADESLPIDNLAQLEAKANVSDKTTEINQIQTLADHRGTDLMQLQSIADGFSEQMYDPIQRKENNTGLPDDLKSGIENLSGHSMDDVNVHRNSDKPQQVQAHAYAQGTDIHLGPGQEKHLPHEAWHVVQQKQGRVKPTMQMMKKVNINDDQVLEKEADVMGNRALNLKSQNQNTATSQLKKNSVKTVQRVLESQESMTGGLSIKDRKKKLSENGLTDLPKSKKETNESETENSDIPDEIVESLITDENETENSDIPNEIIESLITDENETLNEDLNSNAEVDKPVEIDNSDPVNQNEKSKKTQKDSYSKKEVEVDSVKEKLDVLGYANTAGSGVNSIAKQANNLKDNEGFLGLTIAKDEEGFLGLGKVDYQNSVAGSIDPKTGKAQEWVNENPDGSDNPRYQTDDNKTGKLSDEKSDEAEVGAGIKQAGFIFSAIGKLKALMTSFWNIKSGKEDVDLKTGTDIVTNVFEMSKSIAEFVVSTGENAAEKLGGLGEVLGPISAGLAAAKSGVAIYNDQKSLDVIDGIIALQNQDKKSSPEYEKILSSYRQKVSSKRTKDIVNFIFAIAHAISFVFPPAIPVLSGLRSAAGLFMDALEFFNSRVEKAGAKADERIGVEAGDPNDTEDLNHLNALITEKKEDGGSAKSLNIKLMVNQELQLKEDRKKLINMEDKDSEVYKEQESNIESQDESLEKQIQEFNSTFAGGLTVSRSDLSGLAKIFLHTMNSLVDEAKNRLSKVQWVKSFFTSVGKVDLNTQLSKVYPDEIPDEVEFSKLDEISKNYVWEKTDNAIADSVKARESGKLTEDNAHDNIVKLIMGNKENYKEGINNLMGIDITDIDDKKTSAILKKYLKTNHK